MNVLFLTIGRFESIESHSIYPDLLREFRNHGHSVYIVSQREKRQGLPTECTKESGITMLRVCIGNITKCGMIEKGISTVEIEGRYKQAIKRYFRDIKFDLILYSTPPITLAGVVKYVKGRDNARTYLLLKDIFPQNAVDIGLLSTKGVKSIIYRLFRKKEKKLYAISDYIGCMSPANVEYILEHNPEISGDKVDVCPNCIEPIDMSLTEEERIEMRDKYDIPYNRKVFVYGGNLGKPQDIPFLIDCLKSQKDNEDVFFLIVGDGTDYSKLLNFVETEKQANVKLLGRLPKEDYDRMIAACDVGMIFLDHRFTIPNFPSRLLSYMQAKLPVLACTDKNTDIGKVIVEGDFGWWCESNSVSGFCEKIKCIIKEDMSKKSNDAMDFLLNNFTVENSYKQIVDAISSSDFS